MSRVKHKISLLVDKKEIATEGREVELKVDNLPVYRLEDVNWERRFRGQKVEIEDFEAFYVTFLLKAANSIFGHPDRYKLARTLMISSRSFTDLQNLFKMTAPTLDFHLKKLVSGLVVEQNESKKYSLTIIGEMLLEYFSQSLQEARNILSSIE